VGISEERDIWVLDSDRTALTRLTFDGVYRNGAWSPDGEYLAVNSVRGGYSNVYRMLADGTREPEQLTATELSSNVNSWSPDGQAIVFTERHPDTGHDLMLVDADGSREPRFFLQTRFNEGAAKFSPDGTWLAYVSDETGQAEIYVRPYPGPGRKWQISSDGGTEPVWSRNGRELFYRDGYAMMSVDVGRGAEPAPGRPKLLFERPFRKSLWMPNYEIANDGRFIMIEEGGGNTTSPEIRILTNWAAALER
jgi:serine/threonine-protein kinase